MVVTTHPQQRSILRFRKKPTIQLTSGPTCSADLSTYGLDVTVGSGTLTSTSGTLNHSGNH